MPDQSQERFYAEKTSRYNSVINELLKLEGTMLSSGQDDPEKAAKNKLELSEKMLDLESYYLVLNSLSVIIFKRKNVNAINEARKSLSRAMNYAENAVTNRVDALYSEYKDHVEKLAGVGSETRFNFARKMGLAIDILEDAFGDDSKWRWSFIELKGRHAAITKNLFALDKAVEYADPSSDVYAPSVMHLRLIKKLLGESAINYRDRFEIFSKKVDDLHIGRNFMNALKYIHIVLGESDGAETAKSQSDLFESKIQAESRTRAGA
jgi:hypothetical protein